MLFRPQETSAAKKFLPHLSPEGEIVKLTDKRTDEASWGILLPLNLRLFNLREHNVDFAFIRSPPLLPANAPAQVLSSQRREAASSCPLARLRPPPQSPQNSRLLAGLQLSARQKDAVILYLGACQKAAAPFMNHYSSEKVCGRRLLRRNLAHSFLRSEEALRSAGLHRRTDDHCSALRGSLFTKYKRSLHATTN